MILLISIGILAGLFFSSTFILNRLMSLEGGHWVWSACLRYAYMILFLTALIAMFQGGRATGRLVATFFAALDVLGHQRQHRFRRFLFPDML